jgi:hypothetical protein
MGAAIKEFLAENPGVKREDLFVTTKVYPFLGNVAEVRVYDFIALAHRHVWDTGLCGRLKVPVGDIVQLGVHALVCM